MKLPIPFIKPKKKDEKEYFLALLLDDEKAASVILEEGFGKAKVIGKHHEYLDYPLESVPLDELIVTVDKTISKAEEVLPPHIETHKTVFGVKEEWIEKDSKKIKKEYLTKLKKVCDALDLSPIGFMVIIEAVANLIQAEEGAPLSAILAEIGEKKATLTLFRGGKIVETVSEPLGESFTHTIENLLKKFTIAVLPARIVLAATKNSQKLAHELTAHHWNKALPFLHMPHVSALSTGFESLAVAHGASEQMGFELSDLHLSKAVNENIKNEHLEKVMEEKEIAEDIPASGGENFGFVKDADIEDAPREHDAASEPAEDIKHVVHSPNMEPNEIEDNQPVNLGRENNESGLGNGDEKPTNNFLSSKNNALASVMSFTSSIPKPQIPDSFKSLLKNRGLKLPLIIGGAVLLLIIGLMIFYRNGVKAEVLLSVKPNIVNKSENITFSTSSSSDFSRNVIAAKTVSTEIKGEHTIDTTGKKDVGEPAKGNVTIFNNSDSQAQLSSGTQIRSEKGIIFTLDKDVSIASASGDIFSGTKPGTAQAGVTAKDIGSESNLPSGTKFAIGGNTTLAARNDSAFSGGSKKSITVVDKKDLDKLRSVLPKKLEGEVQSELSKKVADNETFLPAILTTTLTEEKFDKKADDEAKRVKLTATVTFIGLIYENGQIEDYSKSLLKDEYSEDIAFAKDSIKTEFSNAKKKSDKELTGTLNIEAGLLPEIDTKEVAEKLQNKSLRNAKNTLSTLPQVEKSDVKFSPNLLFLPNIFPQLPKNITVTVNSE